jgi:UDP-glucose 4-epimerase
MEVINTFEKVTGKKVPYQLSESRQGDVIKAYANSNKIKNSIGWEAQYSLEDSLMSAWNWEKQLKTKIKV